MGKQRGRERRAARIRTMLDLYGLRVLCLRCRTELRWHAERGELRDPHREGYVRRGLKRLRDAPCPVCGSIACRSAHWVATHPELAREASLRARSIARAIE